MATVYRTNPGAGDIISTTEIGGIEVQNIKLVDATAANVGVNGNPLYVLPAAGSSVEVTAASPLDVSASPLSGTTAYLSATEEGNADDVATGAATLYKLTCTLGKVVTAARWLFIFDAATVPGSGRVGLKYPPLLIPEGGMIELTLFDDPIAFSTGLSFGISDDSASYSQAGVANFRALYI